MDKYNRTLHNLQGKKAAFLRGTRLVREIDPIKHILRKPEPSLCFDQLIIEDAKDHGCQEVEVWTSDGAITYRVSFEHFLEAASLEIIGGKRQFRLPLTGWVITRKPVTTQAQMPLPMGGRK